MAETKHSIPAENDKKDWPRRQPFGEVEEALHGYASRKPHVVITRTPLSWAEIAELESRLKTHVYNLKMGEKLPGYQTRARKSTFERNERSRIEEVEKLRQIKVGYMFPLFQEWLRINNFVHSRERIDKQNSKWAIKTPSKRDIYESSVPVRKLREKIEKSAKRNKKDSEGDIELIKMIERIAPARRAKAHVKRAYNARLAQNRTAFLERESKRAIAHAELAVKTGAEINRMIEQLYEEEVKKFNARFVVAESKQAHLMELFSMDLTNHVQRSYRHAKSIYDSPKYQKEIVSKMTSDSANGYVRGMMLPVHGPSAEYVGYGYPGRVYTRYIKEDSKGRKVIVKLKGKNKKEREELLKNAKPQQYIRYDKNKSFLVGLTENMLGEIKSADADVANQKREKITPENLSEITIYTHESENGRMPDIQLLKYTDALYTPRLLDFYSGSNISLFSTLPRGVMHNHGKLQDFIDDLIDAAKTTGYKTMEKVEAGDKFTHQVYKSDITEVFPSELKNKLNIKTNEIIDEKVEEANLQHGFEYSEGGGTGWGTNAVIIIKFLRKIPIPGLIRAGTFPLGAMTMMYSPALNNKLNPNAKCIEELFYTSGGNEIVSNGCVYNAIISRHVTRGGMKFTVDEVKDIIARESKKKGIEFAPTDNKLTMDQANLFYAAMNVAVYIFDVNNTLINEVCVRRTALNKTSAVTPAYMVAYLYNQHLHLVTNDEQSKHLQKIAVDRLDKIASISSRQLIRRSRYQLPTKRDMIRSFPHVMDEMETTGAGMEEVLVKMIADSKLYHCAGANNLSKKQAETQKILNIIVSRDILDYIVNKTILSGHCPRISSHGGVTTSLTYSIGTDRKCCIALADKNNDVVFGDSRELDIHIIERANLISAMINRRYMSRPNANWITTYKGACPAAATIQLSDVFAQYSVDLSGAYSNAYMHHKKWPVVTMGDNFELFDGGGKMRDDPEYFDPMTMYLCRAKTECISGIDKIAFRKQYIIHMGYALIRIRKVMPAFDDIVEIIMACRPSKLVDNDACETLYNHFNNPFMTNKNKKTNANTAIGKCGKHEQKTETSTLFIDKDEALLKQREDDEKGIGGTSVVHETKYRTGIWEYKTKHGETKTFKSFDAAREQRRTDMEFAADIKEKPIYAYTRIIETELVNGFLPIQLCIYSDNISRMYYVARMIEAAGLHVVRVATDALYTEERISDKLLASLSEVTCAPYIKLMRDVDEVSNINGYEYIKPSKDDVRAGDITVNGVRYTANKPMKYEAFSDKITDYIGHSKNRRIVFDYCADECVFGPAPLPVGDKTIDDARIYHNANAGEEYVRNTNIYDGKDVATCVLGKMRRQGEQTILGKVHAINANPMPLTQCITPNIMELKDEKDEAEIANLLDGLRIIYLKALLPGCGKTTLALKYMKRQELKAAGTTVYVAPTNELIYAVQTQIKADDWKTQCYTAHRFLGIEIGGNTGQIDVKAASQRKRPEVVIFDEIGMYTTNMLGHLSDYIRANPKTQFIIAGDAQQLPPIEEFNNLPDGVPDCYFDNIIMNICNGNVLTLKINKRLTSDADRERLSRIKSRIFAGCDIRKLFKRGNYMKSIETPNIITPFSDPKIADAAVNINKLVNEKFGPKNGTNIGGLLYAVGDEVVCTKRNVSGNVLYQVNNRFKIESISKKLITIRDICNTTLGTTLTHIQFAQFFTVPYARTCHAVQGQTMNGNVYVVLPYDFKSPARQKWLWTAVTRARSIDSIYLVYDGETVEPEKEQEKKENAVIRHSAIIVVSNRYKLTMTEEEKFYDAIIALNSMRTMPGMTTGGLCDLRDGYRNKSHRWKENIMDWYNNGELVLPIQTRYDPFGTHEILHDEKYRSMASTRIKILRMQEALQQDYMGVSPEDVPTANEMRDKALRCFRGRYHAERLDYIDSHPRFLNFADYLLHAKNIVIPQLENSYDTTGDPEPEIPQEFTAEWAFMDEWASQRD
jgi:hypothetical protein